MNAFIESKPSGDQDFYHEVCAAYTNLFCSCFLVVTQIIQYL